MINSVRPTGQLINERREKDKKYKSPKKTKEFAKYLEGVFEEQTKAPPKK